MGRRRNFVIPPVALDRSRPVAIYLQLARQLEAAIRRGALDGARLPSTRMLAPLLGISRNTVLAAYDELVARGLLEGRRGSGMDVIAHRRAASTAFAPLHVLREAQYPVRTLGLVDMDGASLYLVY